MNVEEMSVEEIDAFVEQAIRDALRRYREMTPEQRAWEQESAFIYKVSEGLAKLIKLPYVYDVDANYDEETGAINVAFTTRFNHPIEINAEFAYKD